MYNTILKVSTGKALAIFSISVMAAISPGNAIAANHFVSSEVGQVNCRAFNGGVRAGDTIVLESGTRGPLEISNCQGNANSPIVVKNDSSGTRPTVIRRNSSSSGGFVLSCNNCEFFVLDGTDKWSGAPQNHRCGERDRSNACGIQVTSTAQGDAPAAYVAFIGSSKHFTVRGVEVNGRWPDLSVNGIGISINDHSYNLTENPGEWREDIVIENNYIRNVEGECIYAGPNWEFEGGIDDLKLRDIEIANNLITDCGWDGIQLKSAIDGVNSIHHNVILRAGKARDDSAGQHIGISLYESGNGFIHHNWIENAGEHGIQHFLHRIPSSYGEMSSSIYNNVVISPGRTGPQSGKGITVSRNPTAAHPNSQIINNTVIGSEDAGIFIGESVNAGGVIRNNIVADSGATAISSPRQATRSNNLTGSTASMEFVDAVARDYRPRSNSAAVDSGSSQTFAEDDFRGVPRPQGMQPDIGAYEHTDSANGVRPNPPTLAAEP